MSFFPKIHECVIFISIFGQILNILVDYGRCGKHTCCSSGYCLGRLSELCQEEKDEKYCFPQENGKADSNCREEGRNSTR